MRMSIAQKLALGTAAVLMLMVLSAAVAYYKIAEMNRNLAKVVDQAFPAMSACNDLLNGLNHSVASLRGYLLMGSDPRQAEFFRSDRRRAWEAIDPAVVSWLWLSTNWRKSPTTRAVLRNIHMPDMDGITATREIMRRWPVPIVIASATLRKRDVDLAMQGYAAGAVSVIEKPDGAVLLHLDEIGPALRRELLAAARVRFRGAPSTPPATTPTMVSEPARGYRLKAAAMRIEVIGICASTGGPPVLMEIFSSLEHPFPIPVLLVQHISRSFEEGFARWLTQSSGHSVTIAMTGQRLTPGIWIAPSGTHLTLSGMSRVELRPGGPGALHCPSGNPLFESLAKRCGPAAAGILLTGMGNDGAEGLLALRQAGGTTIIQDQASSLIWGMPKAAGQLAAADYELNPAAIARAMMEMARRKADILEGRRS